MEGYNHAINAAPGYPVDGGGVSLPDGMAIDVNGDIAIDVNGDYGISTVV